VLLGLPITERAYGVDALAANFAIISIHAAYCYLLGITTMEIVKSGGSGGLRHVRKVVRAIFSNALMIGITLGFIVNLSGLSVPGVLQEALDLMIRAALPAALFGLGGILYRYRPEGDLSIVAFICALALFLHPAIALALGSGPGGPERCAAAFRRCHRRHGARREQLSLRRHVRRGAPRGRDGGAGGNGALGRHRDALDRGPALSGPLSRRLRR
jgi:predicted permease